MTHQQWVAKIARAVALGWVLVSAALAQQTETGLPPFGSFHGSKFDLVSLQNGNLHIEIPLFSFPQRTAPNVTSNFVYDVPSWQISDTPTTPTTYVWSVAPNPGELTGWHLLTNPTAPWHVDHDIVAKSCTYVTVAGTFTNYYNVHTNYVLTDTHGTKHPFEVRHVDQPPQGCQDTTGNQSSGVALDGSGITITIGANAYATTVSMPNDYGPLNGNSFVASTSSTTTQTDSNGNIVAQTWTISDSTGSPQQFRVDYGPVTVQTNFCTLLAASPCTEFAGTSQLPQKLTLPTGKFYQFTWSTDGNADLIRLDLPTGGYRAYTYSTYTRFVRNQYSGGGTGKGTGPPTRIYLGRRQITSRTVGTGQAANTWTYNLSPGGGGTIHDPPGNDQVHNFTLLGAGANYETQILFYQGLATSGTLLRTINKNYAFETSTKQPDAIDHGAINVRLIRETTILENGLQEKTETDYETFQQQFVNPTYTFTVTRLNPTEKREYDYASGTPGPLLRRTDFTYLHTGNQNYLSRISCAKC